MTHPNPAGFYSLALPGTYENEFTELDFDELLAVVNDLAYTLHCETLFSTAYLSNGLDEFIAAFSIKEKISLLRWLSDRLDYLCRSNEA